MSQCEKHDVTYVVDPVKEVMRERYRSTSEFWMRSEQRGFVVAEGKKVGRLLASALAGVATGLLIGGLGAAQPNPQPTPQVGQRTLERKSPPSCQQGIQDLQLQGQRVNCMEPPAVAVAEAPVSHGPYQIVPAGFVGQLTVQDLPLPANRGVATADLARIRSSSLFVQPAYLPVGYQLAEGDTVDSTSEVVVRLVYRVGQIPTPASGAAPTPMQAPVPMQGPVQAPIEIARRRVTTNPIEFLAPPSSAPFRVDRTAIKGAPAIIVSPKPGSDAERFKPVIIRFVRDGIETIVQTHGLGLPETTRIAESIP